MRVYLIGMPGTGKSSVGKSLADLMKCPLYDLDSEIEKKYKMCVADIFINHGEVGFRKREKATLESFKGEETCVVACGGGTVLDPSNKELMDGKIIWIETELDVIKKRLAIDPNVRPLLQRKALEELYSERKDIYNSYAMIRVSNNQEPIDCAKRIFEILKWRRVLVINGPNLNMLGKRDAEKYGTKTLETINKELAEYASFELHFFQSNHEGEIVDLIQNVDGFSGLIINPGAFTHYSIAIRDALEIVSIPKVEVHLSDITKREEFRKVDLISDVVDKTYMGQKEKSYFLAIDYLKKHFNMV